MIAFVYAPLFFAIFLMGYYVDFTMLETSQSQQSVSVLALPTLKAIQAASELTCAAGCTDGPLEVHTAIPIAVTGTFGTGSMSGVVVSWYTAAPVSAGQGLLLPSNALDASTKSVIGVYNAETHIAAGIPTYSVTVTAPPMAFPVSGAIAIPDGSIILAERRLP